MDKERNPIDCKHFAKPECPKRKELSTIENLVTETHGGYVRSYPPEVFEIGRKICSDCKSFEPKERR